MKKVICKDCVNYMPFLEVHTKLTGDCIIYNGKIQGVNGVKERKCLGFVMKPIEGIRV